MYLHVQVFNYCQILKIFVTTANSNYVINFVKLDINFTINYFLRQIIRCLILWTSRL